MALPTCRRSARWRAIPADAARIGATKERHLADEIYTPDERGLLEAWFAGKPMSFANGNLLAELGFDRECCSADMRLNAWVDAFAARDIQEPPIADERVRPRSPQPLGLGALAQARVDGVRLHRPAWVLDHRGLLM